MTETFYFRGMMEPSRESGLGSDSDNMAELATLLNTEIPEGQNSLSDSHTNLERVAEYCEGNYFQSENKRIALEETKNYTTQSLASVAYQINTLAYNFMQLLDLQSSQLAEMESQMNHIAQTVMIHKEKVARREIGVLTANKTTNRQYKIIAPANPEKPIKYVRKPIDYTVLDDIGHGVRSVMARGGGGSVGGSKTGTVRGGSIGGGSMTSLSGGGAGAAALVGPAPTTKPPTPPSVVRGTGTLSKGSRGEYRTPPAVAPPQVPCHYAPNYPLGHPRRTGAGYSTLPVAHAPPTTAAATLPPQQPVGMVHPLPQSPPPPPSAAVPVHTPPASDRHSMPPPPSPLTLANSTSGPSHQPTSTLLHHSQGIEINHHHHHQGAALPHGMHTGGLATLMRSESHALARMDSQHRASPPLPPPPEEEMHPCFGQPAGGRAQPILSAEPDLPGWVPKNYIEKVVAIYDYYADKDDELSFQESCVIYVLKKNDDGWWEGVMDGITGLFPGNYVEPCV